MMKVYYKLYIIYMYLYICKYYKKYILYSYQNIKVFIIYQSINEKTKNKSASTKQT